MLGVTSIHLRQVATVLFLDSTHPCHTSILPLLQLYTDNCAVLLHWGRDGHHNYTPIPLSPLSSLSPA